MFFSASHHAGYRTASASRRRSRKTAWPFKIFARASARSNHAARSSSGNDYRRPDLGGHSISNILLWRPAGSQSFHRPHVNGLACRLPGFAKRQCFTARAVTGLLVKLAFCRDEGRLSLGDQVFWNRPRCKVLLPAEGTAGMTKQNFGIAAREAIKQETCALFARCGPFHWHAKPHGSPFSACAVGGDEVSRA